MTEEQHNEMMITVFNTMASQAMDQILTLFSDDARIGLVVAFPGDEEQRAIYTGTMTATDAAAALNALDVNPEAVERTFRSRSDGDVIRMDEPGSASTN